jgi:4-alpha-glucanotransferase
MPSSSAINPSSTSSTYGPYPDPFPDVPCGGDLPAAYGNVDSSPPKHRRAGIVLQPTSLPGPYGIGEIGEEALRFIDWLHSAGLQLWQLLPLVPPETTYWSPYSGLDALCGNTLLIPLRGLADLGLLDHAELPAPMQESSSADFTAVHEVKTPLLEAAARRMLREARFASMRR